MRCIHQSSFWFAVVASSLFGVATFLPFWLGRRTLANIRYYSLWYQLLCQDNTCTGLTLLYENDNVPGAFDFEIVVVPVCALIATMCAFVGVLLLELLSCDCGRRADCNPRPVVVFSTVMFWIAVVFSGLAVFIGIAVCAEFYRNDSIDSAGEFPWCLMMFVIGFLLIVAAAILFTIIVCNWNKHSMYFGYAGDDWRDLEYVDNKGFYNRNTSFRDRASLRRSFREGSKVPGGVRPITDSPNLRRSDYGKSTYFDFRLGSPKRSSSYTDLKHLRKSTNDSPPYIREESRKIPRTRSFDEIDPKMMTVARVDSYPEYAPIGSNYADRNVLDVLYRESRKAI